MNLIKKLFPSELATENEQKFYWILNVCVFVLFSIVTIIRTYLIPKSEESIEFLVFIFFIIIFGLFFGCLMGIMSYTKGLKILTRGWINVNVLFLSICAIMILVVPYIFPSIGATSTSKGVSGMIVVSIFDLSYFTIKKVYQRIGIPYHPKME